MITHKKVCGKVSSDPCSKEVRTWLRRIEGHSVQNYTTEGRIMTIIFVCQYLHEGHVPLTDSHILDMNYFALE